MFTKILFSLCCCFYISYQQLWSNPLFSPCHTNISIVLDTTLLPLPSAYDKLHLGIELELSPFILKGYILQGWLSLGNAPFRLRVNMAENDMPKFMLDKRIEKERINSIGAYLDFFLKPQFTGLYFTGGIHYFAQNITTKDTLVNNSSLILNPISYNKLAHNSIMISLGLGYNYYFYKGFYIAPWAGFHTRMSNTRAKNWAQDFTYEPQLLYPEVALKIGWHIGRKKKNFSK